MHSIFKEIFYTTSAVCWELSRMCAKVDNSKFPLTLSDIQILIDVQNS